MRELHLELGQERSVTIAEWEPFPKMEKSLRSTACTWGISLRMAPTCGLLISGSPSTGYYCIVTEKKLREIVTFQNLVEDARKCSALFVFCQNL